VVEGGLTDQQFSAKTGQGELSPMPTRPASVSTRTGTFSISVSFPTPGAPRGGWDPENVRGDACDFHGAAPSDAALCFRSRRAGDASR
jgi:hypothetical protein